MQRERGSTSACDGRRTRSTHRCKWCCRHRAATPTRGSSTTSRRLNSRWSIWPLGRSRERCPSETNFEYSDGKVTLPATAAERGGIQPVVNVDANGSSRAEVRVGEEVTLRVRAEVPADAGSIVGVKWDFDGSGTYPLAQDVDGTAATVDLTTTHAWERPGTYFATALVESHRQGDVRAVKSSHPEPLVGADRRHLTTAPGPTAQPRLAAAPASSSVSISS